MTPTTRSSRSVILLHDQLQDARVWGDLATHLRRFATVQTVSVPPLRNLGSSTAWADHILPYARARISPDVVDLAVTAGGAGGAGIDLVRHGHAHRTLLLDPDPTDLMREAVSASDPPLAWLAGQAEISDRLVGFFQQLEPGLVEGLAHQGTASEEGIRALVAASIGDHDELPASQRQLLCQMATEQLLAALPLEVGAPSSPEGPGWIARMQPVGERCTIAASRSELYDRLEFTSVVHRRVPTVEIVELGGGSPAILRSPQEVSALVRALLRGEPE